MNRFLDQRLKIRHLRVLDAIATHRSLLKAADALNITQPAMTKSLREVEDLIQARLFDRHSKGVTANAIGDRVLATARQVLLELNQLERDLGALIDGAVSPLRVGALPSASVALLPGVIAILRLTRPSLLVETVQGRHRELTAALAVGDLDLVVGRLYDERSKEAFERRVLYQEPIRLMVRKGHPLAARDHLAAKDLTRFPFVLPTALDRARQDIDRYLEVAGVRPLEEIGISSPAATRELMLNIDAVAAMPILLLAGELRRGDVCLLRGFVDVEPRPGGVISRPGQAARPAAAAFIGALEAYLGEVRAGFGPEVSPPGSEL